MAAIDIAGWVTELKDHSLDHGFHVHDERHFVETYSLRQAWEVDLHPEAACGGPIDLRFSLDVDPRVLLAFEDHVMEREDQGEGPDDVFFMQLAFIWGLPALQHPPDLLVLATELAGIGGADLPIEVSAIDSFAAVTDAPERRLSIVAALDVSLATIYRGERQTCTALDRCHAVSEFLLDQIPAWLGSD